MFIMLDTAYFCLMPTILRRRRRYAMPFAARRHAPLTFYFAYACRYVYLLCAHCLSRRYDTRDA